ncbi:hypothetical protein IAT38_008037 [Cryptococcus sp. DSM 104549]
MPVSPHEFVAVHDPRTGRTRYVLSTKAEELRASLEGDEPMPDPWGSSSAMGGEPSTLSVPGMSLMSLDEMEGTISGAGSGVPSGATTPGIDTAPPRFRRKRSGNRRQDTAQTPETRLERNREAARRVRIRNREEYQRLTAENDSLRSEVAALRDEVAWSATYTAMSQHIQSLVASNTHLHDVIRRLRSGEEPVADGEEYASFASTQRHTE